jgi:hypothetical protein
MMRIALRAAAFLFGLGIALPSWAQDNAIPRIFGTATTTDTGAHQVIAAPAQSSLKNCLNSGLVANTGSTDSLITITDASNGAVLAYTVAPAKNGYGGSNFGLHPGICASRGAAVNFTAASSSTTIYITLVGFLGT